MTDLQNGRYEWSKMDSMGDLSDHPDFAWDMSGLDPFAPTPIELARLQKGPKHREFARGTVYLAGPITGETYQDARFGWRSYAAARFYPGIRVLSPMRNEDHLAETTGALEDSYPAVTMGTARAIYRKDKFDIKRSDVVLVNLKGAKSCPRGSLIEMGLADAMDKLVILVVGPGDIADYGFAREAASIVVESLDEAVEIINAILTEGV